MSTTTGPGMPDALLRTLFSVLDVVVLERHEGGAFRQVGGDPPPWFTEAMRHADPGAAVTVVQAFPVLESFLAEADAFWRRTAFGRLEGEAFVVTDTNGRPLPVAPIAAVLEGHHFLLLHRVAGFDERQRVLQRAREGALAHEKLVKQIDGLRGPVARLRSHAAGWAADARRELERLEGLLEELPKPPKAASAKR